MPLEEYDDWVLDIPGAKRHHDHHKVRLYHVHQDWVDDKKRSWRQLMAVIDGKCRVCQEEAPKYLRMRVALWGL